MANDPVLHVPLRGTAEFEFVVARGAIGTSPSLAAPRYCTESARHDDLMVGGCRVRGMVSEARTEHRKDVDGDGAGVGALEFSGCGSASRQE